MPGVKVWIRSFRLRTLPLSLSGVALGNLIALDSGSFSIWICALSLTCALFLQVLSNLANDYGDFVNGADNSERLGPERAVQSGQISPENMKKAIWILAVLSFTSGVGLLFFASQIIGILSVLLMLGIGLAAIIAAIKYTGGSNPYGYRALGDVSVFIFFGLTSILGTAFLHSASLNPIWLVPASGCGLLSTSVLNVNNMRDLEPDLRAGKITIAGLLGLAKAKIYHYILVLMAIALYLGYALMEFSSSFAFVCLLPSISLVSHIFAIHKAQDSLNLDKQLRPLALSAAVSSIFLGIGLFL